MRKISRLVPLLGIIVILALAITPMALAEDSVLEAKVESVMYSMTKTGDPFVRIIVAETKTLQGTSYTVGVPVMAFRDLADRGSKFAEGDTLKAIVAPRAFQGRDSYLVRAWLN